MTPKGRTVIIQGVVLHGEVLASREVTHLARHVEGVQYVQRGSVQFNGLAEPVPVMRVELVESPG